jgi:hypothetical protein
VAHPAIISRDARLGKPAFQFKSCSGAISADIVKNQIPELDSNQDAILLSVGKSLLKHDVGNDHRQVLVSTSGRIC